jgi:hypothetical protein
MIVNLDSEPCGAERWPRFERADKQKAPDPVSGADQGQLSKLGEDIKPELSKIQSARLFGGLLKPGM